MNKLDFVKEMMDYIVEGSKIPKVQVERAVSPIIGLFIGSILTELFKSDDKYSGEYELISPEFPLKKANNLSTNIDYLLINREKKLLVFLELKTDGFSFEKDQANNYIEYKHKVHENKALVLYEELLAIKEASLKKYKYQYIVEKCSNYVDIMKQSNELIIIYLVPASTKEKVKEIDEIFEVITFSELPSKINHDFATYWTIIKECLAKLDISENSQIIEEDISYSNIIDNVNAFPASKRPLGVRLGNTGKGNRPNYQIRFDDGSVEAFLNSGKKASVMEFNIKNLSEEYLWEDFVQQVNEANK